jgi:hypothetical protein
MKVLVDLGTSRTAIAVTQTDGDWLTIEAPRPRRGRNDKKWGELELLIKAVAGIEVIRGDVPHLRNYSRFYQIGDLVVPASISGSAVETPGASTLFPETHGRVFSVKQDPALAEPFLRAMRRLVSTGVGVTGQWVIGRSSGGIDPAKLGLTGGIQSFNEATAVMFAALSGRMFELGSSATPDFAVVADLGGGFLDIAVADKIKYSAAVTSAEVVSFGGYPLGVDRVAERFDDGEIEGGEALAALVRLPIEYHVRDYLEGKTARGARGALILTGGGFKRLQKNVQRRRLQQLLLANLPPDDLTVVWPAEDTKELTLAGLRLLSSQGIINCKDSGRDISGENPNFVGQAVLKASGIEPRAALTWTGLMDDLRRAAFDAS